MTAGVLGHPAMAQHGDRLERALFTLCEQLAEAVLHWEPMEIPGAFSDDVRGVLAAVVAHTAVECHPLSFAVVRVLVSRLGMVADLLRHSLTGWSINNPAQPAACKHSRSGQVLHCSGLSDEFRVNSV
eukprot:Opistho-2@19801